MGIRTCGIEEWEEDDEPLYNRFESTPYRSLDTLFATYTPEEHAYLVDYGCGLGRINFYFHQQWGIRGYGLDVHEDRIRRARENLKGYRRSQGTAADIRFIHASAETHVPTPTSSLFYFFNPFDETIFEASVAQIIASLEAEDRTADLILYYPSEGYLDILAKQNVFKPLYLIDLPWSPDPRDYFMIYRHEVRED